MKIAFIIVGLLVLGAGALFFVIKGEETLSYVSADVSEEGFREYGLTADKETKTYTSSTETTCKDGICNKVLYSGIRFAQEDNQWKKIEDARSLKNSGITCQIVSDGENIAECLDWNMTSVTLKLNKKSGGDSPIRVLKINETKIQKELEKGKELKDLKESEKYDEKQRINYNFKDDKEQKEIIVNADYGDVIHFGEESTTIRLENTNGYFRSDDSVGDTVWVNPQNANIDDSTITTAICSGAGCSLHSQYLIGYNWSANIPNNAIIDGISFTVEGNRGGFGGGLTKYSLYLPNDLFSDYLTRNILGTYTLGNESYLWGEELTPEIINNESFGVALGDCYVYAGPGGSANCNVDYIYLNVTYTSEPPSDSCTCPDINTNWEINLTDSCSIQDVCNLGTGNITFVSTGNVTLNSTINTNKMADPSTGQIIYIGSNGRILMG